MLFELFLKNEKVFGKMYKRFTSHEKTSAPLILDALQNEQQITEKTNGKIIVVTITVYICYCFYTKKDNDNDYEKK